MNELRVNKYITLKLENNETIIYVGGWRFRQCKRLFLINPHEKDEQWEINSIDEAAEKLSSELTEGIEPEDLGISPEQEFWGHCSNLQAWVENDYDPRLLHTNLSIPLLKRLIDVEDKKARTPFKEYIAQRFKNGTKDQIFILRGRGYFDYFSKEELRSLLDNGGEFLYEIEKATNKEFILERSIRASSGLKYQCEKGRITALAIDDYGKYNKEFKISRLPSSIEKLKLVALIVKSHRLAEIQEEVTKITTLKVLDLSGNKIKKIPENIAELRELRELTLRGNEIKEIPESILKLKKLKVLDLGYNQITEVPDFLCGLNKLEGIDLEANKITYIPKPLRELKFPEEVFIKI